MSNEQMGYVLVAGVVVWLGYVVGCWAVLGFRTWQGRREAKREVDARLRTLARLEAKRSQRSVYRSGMLR